ncbi:MAG: hypothetical protein IJ343_10775 [Clostridia bacterium]|nr:hypothetical protein [Clostridia bacterium]
MALTRRLLKELELNDETIGRIIAAHAETVDALRAELDAARTAAASNDGAAAERDALREAAANHQQEAERLRSEYEAYRQSVAAERTQQTRQAFLRAALSRAGANEQALSLLARAIETTDDDWDGDALRDERTVLSPIREQYAAFFSAPRPLPTDRVSPPLNGHILTREDVRRMSAEEINRNWSQVCSALHHH